MGYINSRRLENWLGLLGVASFIFNLLIVSCISPRAYPGYDWLRQAISDLFAQNAPSRELYTRLTSISSIGSIVCVTLACLYVRNRLNRPLRVGIYLFAVLSWVNTMGYSLFPLTESGYAGTIQDFIHTFVVTAAVVILSISSLVVIMVGGYRHRKYRSIAVFATISLCCMMVGSIGLGVVPKAYFGVMERLSVFSGSGFVVVLGCYVFVGFDLIERKHETVSANGLLPDGA